jgi:hypothetical protein
MKKVISYLASQSIGSTACMLLEMKIPLKLAKYKKLSCSAMTEWRGASANVYGWKNV